MKSHLTFMLFLSGSLLAAEPLKLDSDLQKTINLCSEQDKKAIGGEFVKFLENKESQTLEKYLKFDERPDLCDMKFTLREISATRKFEMQYEKSIEKLNPAEKAEKLKSRMSVFMNSLGRDHLGAARVLMYLVVLRGYEMSLKKLNLPETDKWLLKFPEEMKAKKEAIFDKMIAQDSRLFQWYILNEPKFFQKRKPSEEEKIQMVQKLENERKVLADNKECLLSGKCFYCVNEVKSQQCSHETIAEKSKKMGEIGSVFGPKLWEAIGNLNKRIQKYGNFE